MLLEFALGVNIWPQAGSPAARPKPKAGRRRYIARRRRYIPMNRFALL